MRRIIGSVIVALLALPVGSAIAQKRPKPTPTPVSGAQIESGASRPTAPDSATTANSSGPIKKNGIGQLKDESRATDSIKALNAGRIAKILIAVKTGGDDLRDNSTFSAFLITRDGRRIDSTPLNCDVIYELPHLHPCGPGGLLSPGCGDYHETPIFKEKKNAGICPGIPNDQWGVVYWSVDAGVVIYPTDVSRFGISFRGGKKGDLDTGDNWNLDELEVAYIVELGSNTSPAGKFVLFKGSGSPLYRFRTREEWQTPPLKLPQ